MGYKETNESGRGVGAGIVIPRFNSLRVVIDHPLTEEEDIAEFSDLTLEDIGKAITRNLIRDARERRESTS